MAFKLVCPSCGYPYRPRSAATCCPQCKHRPQQSDIQAAALWYFIGALIALILIAAASGR